MFDTQHALNTGRRACSRLSYDEWLATLKAEACVHERDTWMGEMLSKPDKPRKGMRPR